MTLPHPTRTANEILADLDRLRDRRFAKQVAADEYHVEWERLWQELRAADRAQRRSAKRRADQEEPVAKKRARQKHERRPKVYCDGCCEPGQPLGIGVFSAECGIEISLQLDQPGTNNVAECLGAITALQECKKRGITGIRLLSDSQLVVCWATGEYALKSRTARRYVPEIRRLLAEVEATIEWIPGSENRADKYSRNQQSFPDGLSPLEKLKVIPPARLAFKDFLSVRSGRDEFSRMRKDRIVQLLGPEQWPQVVAVFDKQKYQLAAARWFLRGLPLETAILKVEVEREVGHRIAEKRSRRAWDEDQ